MLETSYLSHQTTAQPRGLQSYKDMGCLYFFIMLGVTLFKNFRKRTEKNPDVKRVLCRPPGGPRARRHTFD